jgi:ubiquinone/menaquinone biosynthesis C-methylase UbiE
MHDRCYPVPGIKLANPGQPNLVRMSHRRMEIKIKQLEWEQYHYRFGLAGQGQADIIAGFLKRSPGVVLDIGCGPRGRHVTNLSALSTLVIAGDKDIRAVQCARAEHPMPSNAIFLVANAETLPLANTSVDCVLALGLFAYVRDERAVLSELRRVTKRQGLVIVSNSVAHPKARIVEAASAAELHLLQHNEDFCPAASGEIKRRYLCVFEAVDPTAS